MTVAWELQGSFVVPQVWASGLKKDGAVVGTSEAVEILSVDTCWELLRTTTVARLAVQTANGPDIFPINIAVDGGTLVFRSAEGTKVTAALNGPVAVEADGRDPDTDHAWSVVVKGHTQRIHKSEDVLATVDLPLVPWHKGDKPLFLRVQPRQVTGRRFPIAGPEEWWTPIGDAPRTSEE